MKHKQGGFTLIELLIVVAIIAILTIIITLSIQDSLKKSRDGKRLGDLAQIEKALSLYYDENGKYPDTSTYSYLYSTSTTYWNYLRGKLGKYLSPFPIDPINTASGYYYFYDSDSDDNYQTYGLMAKMESATYQAKAAKDNGWTGNLIWYEMGPQPLYCKSIGKIWYVSGALGASIVCS